ncbi:MAG: hypothetical protein AB1512_06750 [Thermodesulfobacteriota bacterium]
MRSQRVLGSIGCCLVVFLCLAGCEATKSASGSGVSDLYYHRIRDWQKRIDREGWTVGRVNEVLGETLTFVTYRMEIDDHWDTPREFILRGFQGDCEDIAVFMMGTLKYLGYPHKVRVLAVRGTFSGHALLKVEMPDGQWGIYETTPHTLRRVNPARLHPLVEFDEKEIIHLSRQGS